MSTCFQFAKEYTNLTKIPLDAHLDVIAQLICRETPMTHLLWVGQTISWMDGDKLTRAHICKIQVFAQKKRGNMPEKSAKILNINSAKFLKLKSADFSDFGKILWLVKNLNLRWGGVELGKIK